VRATVTIAMLLSLSLGVPGSARAGSATLRVGDVFTVGTGGLGCVVVNTPPIGVSCVLGLASGKIPVRSYAVALWSDEAAIVQYLSPTKRHRVVHRFQPSVRGKFFAKPDKRAPMEYRGKLDDRFLIGGADIVCAIGKASGKGLSVVCRLTDAKLDSIPKTWGIYLARGAAALSQYRDKADNTGTTIIKSEP
jgi:hypothetical protein